VSAWRMDQGTFHSSVCSRGIPWTYMPAFLMPVSTSNLYSKSVYTRSGVRWEGGVVSQFWKSRVQGDRGGAWSGKLGGGDASLVCLGVVWA